MSIAICVGYIMRIITRFFYRIYVQKGKESECSIHYFRFYISKEILGQCLPLGVVTIVDFILVLKSREQYNGIEQDSTTSMQFNTIV